jgi:hypothetical protein
MLQVTPSRVEVIARDIVRRNLQNVHGPTRSMTCTAEWCFPFGAVYLEKSPKRLCGKFRTTILPSA